MDEVDDDGRNQLTADHIRALELAAVKTRRAARRSGQKDCENLVGVGLSGGGIRSASFNLGALQALDAFHLTHKIDYLSTVSGGGYIGASMVAAMSREDGGEFPFAATSRHEVVSDNAMVSHLRDYSRYLMPRGFVDIAISIGIVLRGLAVNALLVLSAVVPLATLTIIMNPTTAHLRHSIFADLAAWLGGLTGSGWIIAAASTMDERYLVSKTLAMVLLAYLCLWGIIQSNQERRSTAPGRTGKKPQVAEYNARLARFARPLLIGCVIAFLLEFQTHVIEWFGAAIGSQSEMSQISLWSVVFGAAAAATAFLRQYLLGIINRALQVPSVAGWVKAYAAKALLLFAALVLPALIYLLYVFLCLWGISNFAGNPTDVVTIPFINRLVPDLLCRTDSWLTIGLLIAAVVLILATFAMALSKRYRILDLAALRYAVRTNRRRALAMAAGALLTLGFLGLVYCINTGSLGPYQSAVISNFLLASLVVILIATLYSENANALHRLYRDRLNEAFQLGSKNGANSPLKLSALDTRQAPYLLINAALNARRSARTLRNGHQARSSVPLGPDPARRGRKAEFFLFSQHVIGSDATGYARSSRYEEVDRHMDLATATAISGAAVSSNMGRSGFGILAPTLALLNLRLGYWMLNPRYLTGREMPPPSWTGILRAYLLEECLGLLRTDSRRIYVTDGGHIDNIGLYQLLKRRCKVIIIIDAEADPALNFGALADAQRFARIDLGVRIDIDWAPIREAARLREKDRLTPIPAGAASHNCHFAIGTITYGAGSREEDKGLLLYAKASLTGDEADYVLDYARRYPQFPHESTLDQFFSEEQMEAYRSLGFHVMRRALSEKSLAPDAHGHLGEQALLLAKLKELLGIEGLDIT